jgi:hypothetical protein
VKYKPADLQDGGGDLVQFWDFHQGYKKPKITRSQGLIQNRADYIKFRLALARAQAVELAEQKVT